MQDTQFPFWQIGYTLADPAAAVVTDLQTDDGNATDREESSSRSVIEAVVRVTASTESLADLSCGTYLSEHATAADRLHREGCDCGDGAIGMIEFQNSDDPDSASVTSLPVVAPDGNSRDNQEIAINTPATLTVASAARQLVVKFDSDEDGELGELQDLPPLPEGNPRKISHPGNTIRRFPKINLGNVIKNSPCGFQANRWEIPKRINHGDFSGTSQQNPITIPDWKPTRNSQRNGVKSFQRNPARNSPENSARISQKNVIRVSLEDPTTIHEGNSSWISLREMGNPAVWDSPKLVLGNPTDNQERDFPSWRWESLANSSNIAGTQAEPSEPEGEEKNAPPSDSAAANDSKEKGSEDTVEKERPKRPSTNETRYETRYSRVSVRGSRIDESNTCGCCGVAGITQRILWLIIYYLLLWGIISVLTWGLLELSLLVTSKGKYPYYMSPHSYCITSPAIGFTGCDPEPGKVTTFDSLTNIADNIDAALGKLVGSARDCDAPAAVSASLSEDALMIPCSMERFAAAMRKKAKQVLADRPALLVEIRRHLGYLPAKGPVVTVKCKSHLSLKYFSWNGTEIVESESSGTVPTDYFPMLTRQHSVPSVLVAIYSASKGDWSGKEVTIKCSPSDGGSGEPAEKSIILMVKA